MQWLYDINSAVNNVVWGPPMLVLLVGTGIYVTIRTNAIQFSRFGLMCRETMGKIFRRGPKAEGGNSDSPSATPRTTRSATASGVRPVGKRGAAPKIARSARPVSV